MITAPPVSPNVSTARLVALSASFAAAIAAFAFFLKFGAADGLHKVDVLRSIFMLVATFWLAWGAMQAVLGLTTKARTPDIDRDKPLDGRIVVLVPIYEEDPRCRADQIGRGACAETRADPAVLRDARQCLADHGAADSLGRDHRRRACDFRGCAGRRHRRTLSPAMARVAVLSPPRNPRNSVSRHLHRFRPPARGYHSRTPGKAVQIRG